MKSGFDSPWGHSKENLPGVYLVDFLCAPHGANTTPVRESDTPLWMCYALFYALAVLNCNIFEKLL